MKRVFYRPGIKRWIRRPGDVYEMITGVHQRSGKLIIEANLGERAQIALLKFVEETNAEVQITTSTRLIEPLESRLEVTGRCCPEVDSDLIGLCQYGQALGQKVTEMRRVLK